MKCPRGLALSPHLSGGPRRRPWGARTPGRVRVAAIFFLLLCSPFTAMAQGYLLDVGDVVKITVYDNPDLTTVARINEAGKIGFPLLGEVSIVQLSALDAGARISSQLRKGGFIKNPQVNVFVERFHSAMVSILGEVQKPGKYPARDPETEDVKSVADLLVLAGGLKETAADYLTVIGKQKGVKSSQRVDLTALLRRGDMSQNLPIGEGDVVFVPRMDMFYIYGEVQKPGSYRLERDMTVMQALAVGGGLTPRGTQRGIVIKRRDDDGKIRSHRSKLPDKLRPDDVIYVKESWF